MAHHSNHSSHSNLSILFQYVRVLFDAWRSTKAQSLLRFHLNFMRIAPDSFVVVVVLPLLLVSELLNLRDLIHYITQTNREQTQLEKSTQFDNFRHFSIFSTSIGIFAYFCARAHIVRLRKFSSQSAVQYRGKENYYWVITTAHSTVI